MQLHVANGFMKNVILFPLSLLQDSLQIVCSLPWQHSETRGNHTILCKYVSNSSGITVLCNGLCHDTNKKDVWQKVEEERKSKHFYWGPWRRINVVHECCLSPCGAAHGRAMPVELQIARYCLAADARQPTYIEIILKNSLFTTLFHHYNDWGLK